MTYENYGREPFEMKENTTNSSSSSNCDGEQTDGRSSSVGPVGEEQVDIGFKVWGSIGLALTCQRATLGLYAKYIKPRTYTLTQKSLVSILIFRISSVNIKLHKQYMHTYVYIHFI